jgi:hypothetical protein
MAGTAVKAAAPAGDAAFAAEGAALDDVWSLSLNVSRKRYISPKSGQCGSNQP